jgi:hypothetical protein
VLGWQTPAALWHPLAEDLCDSHRVVCQRACGLIATFHVFDAASVCNFIETDTPGRAPDEEVTSKKWSAHGIRDHLREVSHRSNMTLEEVEGLLEARIVPRMAM